MSLELSSAKYSIFVTGQLQFSALLSNAIVLANEDILLSLNIIELCTQVPLCYVIRGFLA